MILAQAGSFEHKQRCWSMQKAGPHCGRGDLPLLKLERREWHLLLLSPLDPLLLYQCGSLSRVGSDPCERGDRGEDLLIHRLCIFAPQCRLPLCWCSCNGDRGRRIDDREVLDRICCKLQWRGGRNNVHKRRLS